MRAIVENGWTYSIWAAAALFGCMSTPDVLADAGLQALARTCSDGAGAR